MNGVLLVGALPQAPGNAVLRAAAARFWESLISKSRHTSFSLFLALTSSIGNAEGLY